MDFFNLTVKKNSNDTLEITALLVKTQDSFALEGAGLADRSS